MELIDKSDLVAEIESKKKYAQTLGNNAINNSMQQFYDGMKQGCVDILSLIDTLEVKGVNLNEEIANQYEANYEEYLTYEEFADIAKHFFELGLKASNPITTITKENLESLVRQVIGLYFESGKHYDNVIKEERKEHGGSDLAIKLLDGYIDAEELGIQYVLNKLNAQKGE